jgi:glyoxylase-like metal-dependent hydrolase (beta-lactamase superfamily II)
MLNFIKPLSEEFDNIYFVEGERRGGYPYSHSMLIGDYLIDTGISSGRLRKLKKQFPINKVILSHWHEDHISGNRLLKDAEFLSHPKDKYVIENVNKMATYYGLDGTPAQNILDPIIEGFRIKNTKIDETFEHGDVFEINDLRLEVIHTPGHTAGHCCFLEEITKTIFLADIDLTRLIFYGCIDSNLVDLEESIEMLEKIDLETAVTGHYKLFQGSEVIKEALNRYKSYIYENDQRVLSYLSENNPKSPHDLKNRNVIYKNYGDFKEFEIIAEIIMIEKHLQKFRKNGIVEQNDEGYYLK